MSLSKDLTMVQVKYVSKEDLKKAREVIKKAEKIDESVSLTAPYVMRYALEKLAGNEEV